MSQRNVVTFRYTNSEGRSRVRTVEPFFLWYGPTPKHPSYQFLLRARDVETGLIRDFVMRKISEWTETTVPQEPPQPCKPSS